MPTLFEYFGIKITFYANEHLPVHIHAYYGKDYAMKVEFFLENGNIIKKKYKRVKGFKKFLPAQMRDLKIIVGKYQEDIVKDWINFFIKKKKIKKRIITQRIK